MNYEEEILNYMRSYYKEHGYCPTSYEIGEYIGKHPSTIRLKIKGLKKKGIIGSDRTRSDNIAGNKCRYYFIDKNPSVKTEKGEKLEEEAKFS